MLQIQDKRLRIVVIVALLLIIGGAVYLGGKHFLSKWYFNAATAALERYDYDEASEQLKHYLALNPTDANGLLQAAQVARRRGHFDDAAARLRLAEQNGSPKEAIDAERHLLSVQRGEFYEIDKLILTCDAKPDSPEAAIILEAIIEGNMKVLAPELSEWAIELWLRHRSGKLDQAQGLVWRGRSNLAQKKSIPLPQDDFLQALEKAPDHYQARLWLAAGLIGQEPHKAVEHIDWLRKHRPNDLTVRFQVARYYRNVGQAEDAGRILDEILQLAPKDPVALVERGRVAMELHQWQEAERYLKRAEAISQQREVLLALADCMRGQDGRQDAAANYQKIIEKMDDDERKKAKALKERIEAEKKKKT